MIQIEEKNLHRCYPVTGLRKIPMFGLIRNGQRWAHALILSSRPQVATSHCGAVCTLGDIIAEFSVMALDLRLFSSPHQASFAAKPLAGVTRGSCDVTERLSERAGDDHSGGDDAV
jgi:hypothetical protein